jgi:penicillin-binding protein 1B
MKCIWAIAASERGFAEASVAYFGKDLRQLSLGECMPYPHHSRAQLLPSADRHPERGGQAPTASTRMLDNKYINAEDVQEAKRAPLKIVRTSVSSGDAPYFVDMVKDHLLDKYSENELLSENFRVYTTRSGLAARRRRRGGRGHEECGFAAYEEV